jgi:hypothetical protein
MQKKYVLYLREGSFWKSWKYDIKVANVNGDKEMPLKYDRSGSFFSLKNLKKTVEDFYCIQKVIDNKFEIIVKDEILKKYGMDKFRNYFPDIPLRAENDNELNLAGLAGL